MIRLIALIICLCCAAPSFAVDGIRPNAAVNIGNLADNDSIPVDRPNAVTSLKTTPDNLYQYLYARMSGQVAPAAHDHAVATESANGFMSMSDRLMLSGFAVRSRDEGAVADGTWHSLASRGYTVVSAVERWPYLTADGTLTGTHLIQVSSDLDIYGADWCALQDAINKATAQGRRAVVSGMPAAHIIERSLTTPVGATVDIVGDGPAVRWREAGSSIRPREGVFPTGSALLELAQNWAGRVSSIRLAATAEDTYRGIRLAAATQGNRTEIDNVVIEQMLRGIEIVPISYQIHIHHVRTWQVYSPVYLAAGAVGAIHERPWIESCEFDRGYRDLGEYSILVADGVGVGQPVIERNESAYHKGIYYRYDVTSGHLGTTGEISHNRSISDSSLPAIVTIGAYEHEFRIVDNQCWEGQGGEPRIVVAGVANLIVEGNTASHSSGYVLQLRSTPYSLVLSGNANNNAFSVAHGQLYMPLAEMITNGAGFPPIGAVKVHLGAGHSSAYGQIIPSEVNVPYIDLISYTPRTVLDVVSPAMPALDADTIIQRTAGNLVLWYSNSTMTGKRYRIINKGTAQISVTCPGGGLQDVNGNVVSSLPVAVNGSISVIHMFGGWRQE